ncbi:NAD synthetase [Lysinibacillus sp. NPDC097287]|uniref:NAD synthetase n=1 Tax=Lysinibacillus sp. NPDC097287 TaxID=3364144 RepID=UPI0037FB67E4
MRTSRVSATTSSIFRNEQQYLHAGDISHNFGQNPKQQFKKNMMHNKGAKAVNLKQKKQQRIIGNLAEVYFDSGNDLQMRTDMIETAAKLSRINKQQKRLNSYRSSI